MKLPSMVILLLVVLFSVSSAINKDNTHITTTDDEAYDMYLAWLVKHGKFYDTVGEKEKRFHIFKDNLGYIQQHNSGGHSYKLGLNNFADLSVEEYRLVYINVSKTINFKRKLNNVKGDRYSVRSDVVLPDSVDWRTKGAIAPVKNQGAAGACWAFSAIGSVEAINQIVTGDLITLSEQELVDCDTANQGCNGGSMDHAFNYIIKNGGIHSDKDYPYTGKDGICNNFMTSEKVASIDGYKDVPVNDESALQKVVVEQPVSVSIAVGSSRTFQLYTSGIFNDSCGTDLDHGVVLVGYGTEDGKDYWIVRNSWGVNWGEQGYIRMARNVPEKEGKCGIASWASYPVKNGMNPPNANNGLNPPNVNNGLNPPNVKNGNKQKRATFFVCCFCLFLLEVALSFF